VHTYRIIQRRFVGISHVTIIFALTGFQSSVFAQLHDHSVLP